MTSEFYNCGLEKAKQKDYAGAIEEFNQAIRLDPYFSAAYMERGLTYYNSDAILQGVFDYTEAIKLDGKNAKAYYFRALAKLTLKNLPGALEDIEKAIQLKFNNAAVYDLRGIVQRKQGKIQDAITNFQKAAELYIVQNDKENARLCLDKIQQLKSKSQPTQI
jgi:tetratricopeptide (TPR) repeat protein